MKDVLAIILGGGRGNRLYPLTNMRSKPAVPIGGKYRLIDIPITNCLHSNIKDIYVLTQFNSESLNNHINNTYRFDYFSRAFVRILAAEQTLDNIHWFQGTADAVRKNLFHLNLRGDEDVVILSGDHLYNMDYRNLVAFHRRQKADITISVVPIRGREVKEFGILKLNMHDRIVGFNEKPKTRADLRGFAFKGTGGGTAYLASMGVYVFNASVLEKVLRGNDADFGREVIPHSIRSYNAAGYVFNGYWRDIGTIKSFYEANIEIATYRSHFDFFYKGQVFTRPRFLPPARINDCCVERSLIAEGSIIGSSVIKNSLIGLRTITGKRCTITRAVIMGADYYEDQHHAAPLTSGKIGIGDGTSIDKAIIDKNARIGRNVVIKNTKNVRNYDGDGYYIRDGIVIVPKNGVIKDGTKI